MAAHIKSATVRASLLSLRPNLNRKPNSGQFQKGKFYPCRVATQFKKGNFQGFTPEEWERTFEERMAQKKLQKRVYAKVTKTHLEIQQYIRERAERYLAELDRIATSEETSGNEKLAAIQQLMDRGYGKATQTTVNSNLDGDAKPKELSTDELLRRVDEAIQRAEKTQGLASGVGKEAEGTEGPADLRKYH